MKVKANNKEILNLQPWEKKLIETELFMVDTDEDLIRRLKWVIQHKMDVCYKNLRQIWEPIFTEEGVKFLPTDREEFVNMVLAHPKFKSKEQREEEYKAQMRAQGYHT